MNNTQQILCVLLSTLLIISLAGCKSQQPQGPQGWNGGGQRGPGPRGGPGGFGNMTDEQRQQMMQQRIQSEIDACQGKAENDACIITNPRGEMNGTCTTQNDQLLCRGNRMGNWTRPPFPPGDGQMPPPGDIPPPEQ